MSTESPRSGRRFGTTLTVVIVVLAIAAAGLTGLSAFIPPRLASASISPADAVERTGERLTLTVDQRFEAIDASQVTVEPSTPVEVTSDAGSITVRFTGLLEHDRHYRVRVNGVRSASTGATGDLETSFDTPRATILTRIAGNASAGLPDRLLRSVVGSGEGGEVVYTAKQISEFAPLGDSIAVLSDEGDGVHPRVIGPDGASTTIPGPEGVYYLSLHTAPDGSGFGYVATGALPDGGVLDSVLYLVDRDGGEPKAVTGFAGATLSVTAWAYVPGADRIVVEDYDELSYLIDPSGDSDPVPYGQLGRLAGFLPGTTTIVSDAYPQFVLTDLASGTSTTHEYEETTSDPNEIVGQSIVRGPDDSVQIVQRYDATAFPPEVTSRVVERGPGGIRELYRAGADAFILTACLSRNAQYLAIESLAGATDASTTTIVDIAAGSVVATADGGSSDWCR